MDESLRAVAQLIADYESGIIPEDPLVFSACHQLADAIRLRLPLTDTTLLMEQYVATVTDILTELARQDHMMAALIQMLGGAKPSSPSQVYHVPVAFTISPAQTIVQGDQYNLNGDFRGAIVNLASTLDNTIQQVRAMKMAMTEQDDLVQLLHRLHTLLQDIPPIYTQKAVEVVAGITRMISSVDNVEPRSIPTIQDVSELEQAAARLNGVFPEISMITDKIIKQVQRMRREQ